jgi:hypothetical protein
MESLYNSVYKAMGTIGANLLDEVIAAIPAEKMSETMSVLSGIDWSNTSWD